jgi:RNA polymerase sigma-70 factor (ECF subfamily)
MEEVVIMNVPGNEVELLHSAREGHSTAAEKLFVNYLQESKSIRSLLRRSLSNCNDREEMLHEIYLQLISGQNNFRGEARLSTYIYQIARITVLQKFRRENMLKRRRIEGTVSELDGVAGDHNLSPEHHYCVQEGKRILSDLINQLPAAYRRAVQLRILDDLGYEEIADEMKLPIKTVYTKIHKGKNLLINFLKEKGLAKSLYN